MRKTSTAVLALLFATCEAVKVNKVEGYESVDNGAEGVHVLDLGMHTMSNSPADAGEFAFPNIRTAFYAQTGSQFYDDKNQLWRHSLAQKNDITSETAVNGAEG
jgi:hypothetical protein